MCFLSTYEGGRCYGEWRFLLENSKRASMRDTSVLGCLQRARVLMEPLRESRDVVPPERKLSQGYRNVSSLEMKSSHTEAVLASDTRPSSCGTASHLE